MEEIRIMNIPRPNIPEKITAICRFYKYILCDAFVICLVDLVVELLVLS